MSGWNAVRLLKGTACLTNNEYKRFEKGDLIYGNNAEAEEIARWSIDKIEEAKAELAKNHCIYAKRNEQLWSIEEYALEYYSVDEDGEYDYGADYDLAEEL